MASIPPVVYIAGSGRSGSTLLEGLLCERMDAVGVGELAYVWNRGFRLNERCGCGEPFSQCPFWREVAEQAFGSRGVDSLADSQRFLYRMRNVPKFRVRAFQSGAFREHLAQLVDGYERLYEAIAAVSGAAVIIDSSKFAVHGHLLAELTHGDLRVIHLIRDSRAVAYAWQKQVRRPEATTENLFMPTFGARTSANIWLQDIVLSAGLRRQASRSVVTRYEDLVVDPQELDRVIGRLGVPTTAVSPGLSGAVAAPPTSPSSLGHPGSLHSVSGNPSRLAQSGGSRGPLRLDEAWRRGLSARDRRVVTWMTAPYLMRYGYVRRPAASSARATP